MANDTNKIKLLVLWDILCKNTDENHAMNSDEIREELAKRGISVMRKVVATDIAALNKYGYVDRDIISQFVDTVIPRSETCYEWYMDFDLIEKPNEKKKMVWSFKIDYNEAKTYRKEREGMLRPNQWEDLIVRVYI